MGFMAALYPKRGKMLHLHLVVPQIYYFISRGCIWWMELLSEALLSLSSKDFLYLLYEPQISTIFFCKFCLITPVVDTSACNNEASAVD